MSVWLFITIATAFCGALILWYSVSRTKHVSEQLLTTYRQMLTQAREERVRKLAQEAELEAEEQAKKQGAGEVPQAK